MRSNASSSCITRVVVDGDQDIHVSELQRVMHRIRHSLRHIPEAQRTYIGNALLILAVCRMLSDEGAQRTATALIRLADAVLDDPPPSLDAPLDLLAIQA